MTIFALQASAQEYSKIPSWIKNNARLWTEGTMGDIDFTNGIQYLISNDIIKM